MDKNVHSEVDDDEPCTACGGAREVEVDCFTSSRGHFTTREPCEFCIGDEYSEPFDDDSLAPFERGLPVRGSPEV